MPIDIISHLLAILISLNSRQNAPSLGGRMNCIYGQWTAEMMSKISSTLANAKPSAPNHEVEAFMNC